MNKQRKEQVDARKRESHQNTLVLLGMARPVGPQEFAGKHANGYAAQHERAMARAREMFRNR
jgi:hypothetical protein